MASVSSLDKDLRKLRAEKYTPQAAGEAKSWIESVLGEKLPQPDLLDALKDGVALCKLVNKVLPPPGIKFKQSAMPFVQMENISIFLRLCKAPPLNLLEHDVFLTVDLYERKDPAQVLQCIGAFSRAANAANPSAVPAVIGPKGNAHNNNSVVTGGAPLKSPGLPARNTSTASNATVSSFSSSFGSSLQPTASPLVAQKTGGSVASSRWGAKSPTLSATTPSVSGSVSSWSSKNHEGTTSPAWNIAQYGYMGGASQGTMGVSFGGRRQITTAAPTVPSVQEKERKRKEAEAEAGRRKEEEQRKKAEKEAAEKRARQEEERRWEDETRKAREEERKRLEEEKRRWQEEERQWKLDQERRRKEEEEAERRLQAELKQEEEKKRAAEKQIQNQAQAQAQNHTRERSDPRLRGQLLSQYQAEESRDKERIRELERELEKARRREAEYERERQERSRRLGVSSGDDSDEKHRSRSRPARPISRQDSWKPRDERRFSSRPPSPLVQDILDGYLDSPVQPAAGARSPRATLSPRPLPDPTSPSRPLPIPANPMLSPPQKLTAQRT
ncbi:calponin, partial [Neurospora sp. IMI 360204]